MEVSPYLSFRAGTAQGERGGSSRISNQTLNIFLSLPWLRYVFPPSQPTTHHIHPCRACSTQRFALLGDFGRLSPCLWHKPIPPHSSCRESSSHHCLARQWERCLTGERCCLHISKSEHLPLWRKVKFHLSFAGSDPGAALAGLCQVTVRLKASSCCCRSVSATRSAAREDDDGGQRHQQLSSGLAVLGHHSTVPLQVTTARTCISTIPG